jgi:ribosomal protein L14E/L6E/L27E
VQVKKGMIVKSQLGHDSDRFYVVLSIDNGKAFICDGKLRKLDKPKAKNIKHLSTTNVIVDVDLLNTDKKIRQALWSYNYGKDAESL